ncbi:MAG TPA: hypothetical protein VND63_02450 [Rhodanobacteraceae bacterium]|nr:hypothetical protein [Rhodanobacteraceae bacterium]
MRLPAAPFRRLLALALLAWSAMALAAPLPAVHPAPAMAMTHAAPMLHAGQTMAAHCADASTAGHDGCGQAQHACGSGHCCDCTSVCGAAVLPVAALSMQTPRAGRELLRLRRLALAPMITAPPLRPPAV